MKLPLRAPIGYVQPFADRCGNGDKAGKLFNRCDVRFNLLRVRQNIVGQQQNIGFQLR